MTIKNKSNRKPEIDISGPAGNAFALMGAAQSYAKQLDYTKEELDELINDMQSSDYDHLLEVFDYHFGTYVDLVR